MKAYLALVLLFSISPIFAREAAQTLAEQMALDNPAVIAYLGKLDDGDVGSKLKGVRLSDGTVELKGCTFLGSHIDPSRKQHIYTFRCDGHEISYVWIDKGGKSLSIPPDPADSNSSERASILSGDIYTYPIVEPGDGIVILYGGTMKWLKALKANAKK